MGSFMCFSLTFFFLNTPSLLELVSAGFVLPHDGLQNSCQAVLLFDPVKNNQGKCCQLHFSIPAKSHCPYGARWEGAQRLISAQSATQPS